MSVAEYYEQYWSRRARQATGPGGVASEIERLYREHVAPRARVLDLGCGDGHASGPLLTELGACYVGVDVSRKAVQAARASGLEAHVIDDAGRLPLEDASFDVAVCIEVLEHLFRPDEAVTELARVLRPRATVLLTTPNVAYWRRRTDLALFGRWHPGGDDRAVQEPWRDPHIRFFGAASLRRLLECQGFEHVRIGGHDGGVLRELPGLRRLGRGGVSVFYRRLERGRPALLGARLHAVATRTG